MSRSVDPSASRWIEEIRRGLRLSPKGVLILVDHAIPEKLGALVRALLLDHPGLDVHTDVVKLSEAADGSVIVFLPRAADAEWLNLNRPMFARKALKVVLFCERDVSVALSQRAPDFYDWISHRQECPAGAAPHAIFGIRSALYNRAPGLMFVVHRDREDRVERVERTFHEALPGRQLRWLDPRKTPYAELVRQIREAGRAWVACNVEGPDESDHFRWALAEARRRTRAILLLPETFEDRFWTVLDTLFGTFMSEGQPLAYASKLLANAGAKHPGRLAAIAGLEIWAIIALIELLARDYREEVLLEAMLRSPDPGAGLGEKILSAGIEVNPLQGWSMSPLVQRHLGKRIGLRRRFPGRARREVKDWHYFDSGGGFYLLLGRAARIEWLLCHRDRSPDFWLELARLALEHGAVDAATTWAERAIAMRKSSEAYRLHGIARAELGRMNWEAGHPAGAELLRDAERSLRRAEETLDPSTLPEDALTLYAHRAELLMDTGLTSDAEWPLRRALRLVDMPSARVSDMRRVAQVLSRAGRADRAEEILKAALEKTDDPRERSSIRLDLGWLAFARKRLDEAESIAATLSEENPRVSGADEVIRIGADSLRVRIRLSRGEPREALALADTTLAASYPHAWIDRDALSRMPLLAISLNRAGRARDAEVILRKLLGLPSDADASTVALGLSSRDKVLAFLKAPLSLGMDPSTHSDLRNELVQALRAQGRYLEANEIEQ